MLDDVVPCRSTARGPEEPSIDLKEGACSASDAFLVFRSFWRISSEVVVVSLCAMPEETKSQSRGWEGLLQPDGKQSRPHLSL